MSNIEEDIMSEEAFNELIDNFEIVNTLTEYGRKAIKQNVKKLQKRIKELEAKLEFKSYGDLDNIQFEEYLNQFIPKQKVKDKIEENNKIMIDTQNKYPGTYAMLDEWRNAKAQNDILEELLEEK